LVSWANVNRRLKTGKEKDGKSGDPDATFLRGPAVSMIDMRCMGRGSTEPFSRAAFPFAKLEKFRRIPAKS